jgi:hypothetical protein
VAAGNRHLEQAVEGKDNEKTPPHTIVHTLYLYLEMMMH